MSKQSGVISSGKSSPRPGTSHSVTARTSHFCVLGMRPSSLSGDQDLKIELHALGGLVWSLEGKSWVLPLVGINLIMQVTMSGTFKQDGAFSSNEPVMDRMWVRDPCGSAIHVDFTMDHGHAWGL